MADIKKISDHVWLTPNGIVDFKEKPKLTPQQEASNARLDFEIMMADKEHEHREKQNALKIEAWNKWLEKNPDYPFKACHNLDMTPRRKVFGIRYVE